MRDRTEEPKLTAGRNESPSAAEDSSELSVLEDLVEQQSLELEEAQSRLRLSERMAALGNLSAGLAHDMGNLLLPIRVRLDALEERGLGAEAHRDLDAIKEAVQHLQRLANGLRLFSLDPNHGARGESTALAEWWLDVEPFFRHALGRGARIDAQLETELPPVQVGRHRITQAIYYLLQNARDAAPPDAELRVSVNAQADGDWVDLRISDNGRGMSPGVLDRCLEPYYTTKTRSTSTGLGLSLVHGIVEKAGGKIDISSVEGQGTTITLRFKCADAARSPKQAAGSALLTVTDARVRSYLAGLLRAHGYAVRSEERLPLADESVWVSDPSPGIEHLQEFAQQSGKWAVVLNDGPFTGPGPERLVSIPASPKPSLFRETLERIAESVLADEDEA